MSVNVDTSHFDSTFKTYVQLNKRALGDLINKVGYEVGKLCGSKTASVPKETIRNNLQQPSRISPTMTIAEVIANKIRITAGQEALYGSKLRTAGLKYARLRARSSNFLRSGFIPGVRAFEKVVKDKSARSINGVRAYGQPKGGAEVAAVGSAWTPKGSIWNAVLGGVKKWFGAPGRNTGKVQDILSKGVQEALNTKEADMMKYIEPRLNRLIQDFNKA